jgi:hypothetical protein
MGKNKYITQPQSGKPRKKTPFYKTTGFKAFVVVSCILILATTIITVGLYFTGYFDTGMYYLASHNIVKYCLHVFVGHACFYSSSVVHHAFDSTKIYNTSI